MGERRAYRVHLALRSPFMFEGTVNTRTGVDASFLRDLSGHPIIPSTQMRGVMKAALKILRDATSERLVTSAEIDDLFGQSSDQATEPDLPLRGCAIFSDLVGPEPGTDLHTTRIRIDEDSGIVARGAIQIIELAAKPGAVCDFVGSLVVRYPKNLDPARVEKVLRKAFALIPSIGAYKSVGFGEILHETSGISEEGARRSLMPKEVALPPGGLSRYAIEFDRPVLFDAYRLDENIYKSSYVLPGGALKGAIAERLKLGGRDPATDAQLGPALSQLRVSHAFPMKAASGTRLGLPIPHSIVFAEKDEKALYADAIEASYGKAPILGSSAADYVSSAKTATRQEFREQSGLLPFDPVEVARTHVEIHEANLSARDGRLYSTVCLAPADQTGALHRWCFSVDYSKVKDLEAASTIAAVFGEPLDGIGRTGATGVVVPFNGAAAVDGDAVPDKGLVDIVLVTPAVLAMPDNGKPQLSIYDAHARYFEELSSDLRLQNVFARRSMAGGYQAMRRRPYGSGTYYPFILTSPGSVFRLEVAGAGGAEALRDALRFGLPVPTLGGKVLDWRNCPFVRENGYGEIAIHLLTVPPASRFTPTFVEKADVW